MRQAIHMHCSSTYKWRVTCTFIPFQKWSIIIQRPPPPTCIILGCMTGTYDVLQQYTRIAPN